MQIRRKKKKPLSPEKKKLYRQRKIFCFSLCAIFSILISVTLRWSFAGGVFLYLLFCGGIILRAVLGYRKNPEKALKKAAKNIILSVFVVVFVSLIPEIF